MIWFCNLFIRNVPNEDCSRNVSCELNYLSSFVFVLFFFCLFVSFVSFFFLERGEGVGFCFCFVFVFFAFVCCFLIFDFCYCFFFCFLMIIENCQMYIFAILSYHIYSLRILLLFLVSDVSQLILHSLLVLLSANIYRQWWAIPFSGKFSYLILCVCFSFPICL